MTLFASVVATSRQVAETSARSVKTRLLADCLRTMNAEELEIAVLYLSGEIRQGRIGIGPSALRACAAIAASTPSLHLMRSRSPARANWRRSAAAARARDARLRCGRCSGAQPARSRSFWCGCWWASCGKARSSASWSTRSRPSPACRSPEVRRAAMYESNLGAIARAGLEAGAAGTAAFPAPGDVAHRADARADGERRR